MLLKIDENHLLDVIIYLANHLVTDTNVNNSEVLNNVILELTNNIDNAINAICSLPIKEKLLGIILNMDKEVKEMSVLKEQDNVALSLKKTSK